MILRGDAGRLPLPDASVDLVVTSPPYFGLRSYTDGGEHYAGQIGSEETPREYIAALLACTREWVRVLKPQGSLFVNLGDKYAGVGGSNGHGWCIKSDSTYERRAKVRVPLHQGRTDIAPKKSLMGLPWRYALGCVDDLGLILRAEIVWAKPNGLPESVQDRVRRSHEQVFHFTRQPRYYAAVDEIREPHVYPKDVRGESWRRQANGATDHHSRSDPNPLGKLPGSVWDIPSQPLTVPAALGISHFAAFPMELPRRIILGWSPPGICTACGEGRRPVASKTHTILDTAPGRRSEGSGWPRALTVDRGRRNAQRDITGYACACPQPDAPVRPALVVDPFGGTGTTALVADVHGRHGISIDMSADYCRLAQWRTADPKQRERASRTPKQRAKAPRKAARPAAAQDSLFA